MIVHTPVAGFTGDVVGIRFEKGVAEVDSAHPAIAYFVRHGYMVEADEKPKQARARTK